MRPPIALAGGAPDDEEAVAAIAAVLSLLDTEAVAATHAPQPTAAGGWQVAARLLVQGIVPTRMPAAPGWGRIERLRRAARGGSGIVGQ